MASTSGSVKRPVSEGSKGAAAGTALRDAELRHALRLRRTEMQNDLSGRVRSERANRPSEGRDALEMSDDDNQGDLELALLEMRAETVRRIDEALLRLDAGQYGICVECGDEIAATRLRALPFAVRCQECQGRREQAEGGAIRRAQQARRGDLADLSGPMSHGSVTGTGHVRLPGMRPVAG